MPNEEIRYTFTGDASGLQNASQQAIDSLKRVETAEKDINTSADFSNLTAQIKALTSSYTPLLNEINAVSNGLLISAQSCAAMSQGLVAVNFIIQQATNSLGQLTAGMQAIPLGTTSIAGALPQVSSAFAQYEDALRNAFMMEQQNNITATALAAGLGNVGASAVALIPEITSAAVGSNALSTELASLGMTIPTVTNAFNTEAAALTRIQTLWQYVKAGAQDYQNTHYNLLSSIMQSIPTLTQQGSAFSNVRQAVQQVNTTMAQNSIARYINSHNNLTASILKQIPGMKEYAEKVKDADSKQKQHNSTLNKSKSAFSALGAPIKKAASAVGNLISRYLNLQQVVELIKNCIKASNDWIESLNLFSVASGNYYDSMKANVDSLAYFGGAAEKTLMDAAGSFKLFTTEMGVAEANSAKMSDNLTKLTMDMASLYNKDFSEVASDLESGLQGMTKSVRKYGIDVSSAALEETARKAGIEKSISAMTQAEKTQLRYMRIIEQTNLSQGDFARTIQTPANMLKILKDQIRQTGVYLGNLFQPALQSILPVLIKFAFVVQEICKWLATLIGYDATSLQVDTSGMESGTATAAENLDDAASSAKEAKKQLAGFDELNNLSSDSGKSSGDSGAAGGGLSFDIPGYDSLLAMTDFLPNLRTQAASITEEFKKWFNPIRTAFSEVSGPLHSAATRLKKAFGEIGKTIAKFVQDDLTKNWAPGLAKIAPIVATLVQNFSNLFKAVEPLLVLFMGFIWDNIAFWLQLFSDVLGIISKYISDFSGPLESTFASLRGSLGEVMKVVNGIITDVIETVMPIVLSLITSVGPQLFDAITQVVKVIGNLWKTLWPVVSCLIELLAPILEVIINVISAVVGIVAPIINIVLKLLNFVLMPIVAILKVLIAIINSVLKVVSAVVGAIQKAVGGLFNWFDGILKKGLNGLIGFLNKILAGVEKGINFVLKGVNKVISWINKIPGFNLSELHVAIPRIGSFATGGFPEDGLFFANHNELVGKFTNGATAVANNEQIIQGIEGGVERGMLKALRDSNMGNDSPLNIYLDSDVLFRAMVKKNNAYKRSTGKSAFA